MSPAVGFRFWRIDERPTGPQLASPYRTALWLPGLPLEAKCKETYPHRELPMAHQQEAGAAPPVHGCSCGVYAYHQADQMIDAIASGIVGGAVLCWGRITIHAEGLRAQFARPLALCYPPKFLGCSRADAVLVRLATAYRLPLLDTDHIEVFAAEFGESFQPESEPSGGRRLSRSVRRLFGRWFGG